MKTAREIMADHGDELTIAAFIEHLDSHYQLVPKDQSKVYRICIPCDNGISCNVHPKPERKKISKLPGVEVLTVTSYTHVAKMHDKINELIETWNQEI